MQTKKGFPKVAETDVSWGEKNLCANRFKAIVNPETSKVYSIVSKDYRLIRHEDAVQKIERTIDDYPDLGNYRAKTRLYNDGGRMCRTYCFHKIAIEIEPRGYYQPRASIVQ